MPIVKNFVTVCKQCDSPHINLTVNHHIENPATFDIQYYCTVCQNSESVHFDAPVMTRKEYIQNMVEASRVAQS